MATFDDFPLVIYHVDDGEDWAKFLSVSLMGPNYGIHSIVKNLSTIENAPAQNQKGLNDSGRGSRTIHDSDYINSAKAHIFLLSPQILDVEHFPFDVSLLNPRRSLFLLLGVEIEDVRAYFGELSDLVFKSRCCLIHSDEKAVRDALVEIIKTYEDSGESSSIEDDIYQTPPSPRQLNRIEKVLPRELIGKDREVHFLLERPAEDDLVAVLDNYLEEIPVTCVCDRLYKFTLPDDASGEISFKVECQNHCIGEDSVLVLSKLDQIKAILNEEIHPLAVLASALGLVSDDTDSIDTALASKLQQLSSVTTFQEMFPYEDALNNSLIDQRAEVIYPTLLHFAADWNLQKFCSQLLQYPGMVCASLTENKDGDYPNMMASKKGYTKLESDLLEFVCKQNSPDNSLYVEPSPPVHPPPVAPKPHVNGNKHGYVNQPRTTHSESGVYISMSNLKDFRKTDLEGKSQTSDTVSQCSDNVFTGTSVKCDLDNLDHNFITGWSPDQTASTPPGLTSKKALKMLGVNEEEIKRSKTSTLNRVYPRSEFPANIPHSVRFPGVSAMPVEQDRISVSSNCDDPTAYGVYQQDPKHKVNKFAAFFGRIKNKRSSSEGENIFVPAREMKKTQSTRSEKQKKIPVEQTTQERDSGSYSDEENGHKISNAARRSHRQKDFKEREKPMTRQRPLSRRVQIAKQEHIRDAPKVPSSGRRTGSFTSFIENF